MSTQNKDTKTSPPGALPNTDQKDLNNASDNSLQWQTGQAQESTTTEHGSSKGGETRRGGKKPEHTFSKRVPEADSFAIGRMTTEDQNGTAPWVPVWSLTTSGGGGQ